jgi:hypothetical protein
VFGVPAFVQEIYWWWVERLFPWDLSEIDLERAIQQITVPVMVRLLLPASGRREWSAQDSPDMRRSRTEAVTVW